MKKTRKIIIIIASLCICAGIAITAVGVVMCSGNWREYLQEFSSDFDEGKLVSADFKPEDSREIESISIDLKQGNVILEPGEDFSVQCTDVKEGALECRQSGSTWYVKDKSNWRTHFFSMFDFKGNTKIVITIPEERVFRKVSIDLGAGKFTGSQICADKLTMSIGAGDANIDSMLVTKQANLEVGAGKLSVVNGDAYDVKLECGAGKASWTGRIEGDSKIDCGMGNITLALHGRLEDYEYSVDCGLGNVNINDKSYSSVNSSIVDNEQAENELRLECGMGNIDVDINEGN